MPDVKIDCLGAAFMAWMDVFGEDSQDSFWGYLKTNFTEARYPSALRSEGLFSLPEESYQRLEALLGPHSRTIIMAYRAKYPEK